MSRRIERLFAKHGLRCTRQRKAVYEALAAARTHPTADELHQRVSKDLGGVSLATVYNTLEAFSQAGIVQKLPGAGENGSARYDALNGEPHLHVRCRKTGVLDDVPTELSRAILSHLPPQTLRDIERRLGFKIDQVQIELLGQYEKPHASAGD